MERVWNVWNAWLFWNESHSEDKKQNAVQKYNFIVNYIRLSADYFLS